MREALNFSDTIAFSTAWHQPGMRYIEVSLSHTRPLKMIAAELTLDDRFAVDLTALQPNETEMRAHGYIFRNIKEDDHHFKLGDMDPVELSEVLSSMNANLGIVYFQATECLSTDIRGCAVRRQKIQKTR